MLWQYCLVGAFVVPEGVHLKKFVPVLQKLVTHQHFGILSIRHEGDAWIPRLCAFAVQRREVEPSCSYRGIEHWNLDRSEV